MKRRTFITAVAIVSWTQFRVAIQEFIYHQKNAIEGGE